MIDKKSANAKKPASSPTLHQPTTAQRGICILRQRRLLPYTCSSSSSSQRRQQPPLILLRPVAKWGAGLAVGCFSLTLARKSPRIHINVPLIHTHIPCHSSASSSFFFHLCQWLALPLQAAINQWHHNNRNRRQARAPMPIGLFFELVLIVCVLCQLC